MSAGWTPVQPLFSRLSSSSVWEEEDPLRTVMSVCSDVALICGHFSRASCTFLCMRPCTRAHVYIHTVLCSLNLLLYLYEVITSCFVHNIKRTSTPECRQWGRNRFWHHSALIRLRFCMRASSNCARLQWLVLMSLMDCEALMLFEKPSNWFPASHSRSSLSQTALKPQNKCFEWEDARRKKHIISTSRDESKENHISSFFLF